MGKGMETFLTKNRTRGMELFAKNRTERDDRSSTQNGTELDRSENKWNINETIEEKEQEQNDLAEGPYSRMKWNDFKKVETCPALESGRNMAMIGNNRRVGRTFLWLKPIPGKSL